MLVEARQRVLQLAAQAAAFAASQSRRLLQQATVQTVQEDAPAGNFLASWAGPALLPTASTGTQLRSAAAVAQSTPRCLSRSGTLQHRRIWCAHTSFAVLGVLGLPMGEDEGLTICRLMHLSQLTASICICSTDREDMIWGQASASACIPQRHDAANLL